MKVSIHKNYIHFDYINFSLILDLSVEKLRRKIELCKNVLAVYDKVDPGQTNQRTNVIFELNCAKIIECQLKYRQNLVNKLDALVSLLITSESKFFFPVIVIIFFLS